MRTPGGSSGGWVNATWALVLFLGLKALADLVMHAIEHAEEKLPTVTKESER